MYRCALIILPDVDPQELSLMMHSTLHASTGYVFLTQWGVSNLDCGISHVGVIVQLGFLYFASRSGTPVTGSIRMIRNNLDNR